jgi:quercetin dioxygenase-like cupin family protein
MTSVARSPQEGQSVWLGGLAVAIKISSRQTGRAFSLVECTLERGRLVPPHVHTREDEYTYVLEGEIGIRIGDQIVQATAGCTVVKPRGIPHTFWDAFPYQDIAHVSNVLFGALATFTIWRTMKAWTGRIAWSFPLCLIGVLVVAWIVSAVQTLHF